MKLTLKVQLEIEILNFIWLFIIFYLFSWFSIVNLNFFIDFYILFFQVYFIIYFILELYKKFNKNRFMLEYLLCSKEVKKTKQKEFLQKFRHEMFGFVLYKRWWWWRWLLVFSTSMHQMCGPSCKLYCFFLQKKYLQ